jgi:hypothetical protein
MQVQGGGGKAKTAETRWDIPAGMIANQQKRGGSAWISDRVGRFFACGQQPRGRAGGIG